MNNLRIVASVIALVCLYSTQVGAVVLNDLQLQTVNSQDFVFNFGSTPASDGNGGTFIIHARGDYGMLSTEVLEWDVEGVVSAGPLGAFPDVLGPAPNYGGVGGPFDSVIIHSLGPDDYEFTRSYSISSGDLQTILADSSVMVSVDLDVDVSNLNEFSFVEVTLEYMAIPEPSTAALSVAGLMMGTGLLRRKRV